MVSMIGWLIQILAGFWEHSQYYDLRLVMRKCIRTRGEGEDAELAEQL